MKGVNVYKFNKCNVCKLHLPRNNLNFVYLELTSGLERWNHLVDGLSSMQSRNRNGYTGLFIPGPTNVPDRIRQAMNVPMQDMRAPDFGDLTLPLFADVKKVMA